MEIFVSCVTLLIVSVFLQHFWIRVLPWTWLQDSYEVEGEVVSVERLDKRVWEVSLLTAEKKAVHIHFRSGEKIPQSGEHIQAFVNGYHYWLRETTLAWVEEWDPLSELEREDSYLEQPLYAHRG